MKCKFTKDLICRYGNCVGGCLDYEEYQERCAEYAEKGEK